MTAAQQDAKIRAEIEALSGRGLPVGDVAHTESASTSPNRQSAIGNRRCRRARAPRILQPGTRYGRPKDVELTYSVPESTLAKWARAHPGLVRRVPGSRVRLIHLATLEKIITP